MLPKLHRYSSQQVSSSFENEDETQAPSHETIAGYKKKLFQTAASERQLLRAGTQKELIAIQRYNNINNTRSKEHERNMSPCLLEYIKQDKNNHHNVVRYSDRKRAKSVPLDLLPITQPRKKSLKSSRNSSIDKLNRAVEKSNLETLLLKVSGLKKPTLEAITISSISKNDLIPVHSSSTTKLATLSAVPKKITASDEFVASSVESDNAETHM
jgi:hypothetical protein